MSTDEFKKYKYTGHATATVTISVPVKSSWGGDCSVAQIHSQATDEVKGFIRNNLAEHGVRIIGEPKIEAVMAVREGSR